MTVNPLSDWSMTLDEIAEIASGRAGGEPVLGKEAREVSTNLNLLFTDMQNRGVLLYTMEMTSLPLVVNQTSYTLPSDTLDILETVMVWPSGINVQLGRISYAEYMDIPNKTQSGVTSQFMLDRQRDAPILYPWPIIADANYSITYTKVRFIHNSGPLSYSPDAPRRYIPAVVSGLAYMMALNRTKIPLDRLAMLENKYLKDLELAMEEDRERASVVIKPKFMV